MNNPSENLSTLATLVDFIGTLLIGVGAGRAFVGYLRQGNSPPAVAKQQYGLAADLISALSFKTGAGLIRSLTVVNWPQFYLFLAIVALRFFLSQALKRQNTAAQDKV